MRLSILSLVSLIIGAISAMAIETGDSGLPIPRFVSLGDDRVNARAGPGFRFPINWVYLRKHLPVEIIDEFGHWRRIQDIEGFESWIHRSMLSGKRSFITSNLSSETSALFLRVAPREQSTAVAQIKTGAQGVLLECSEKWCLVELSLYRGWMSKKHLWGVYENEQIE